MESKSEGGSNSPNKLKVITEPDGSTVIVLTKAALMKLVRKYFALNMVDLPLGFILEIELNEWKQTLN